MSDRRYFNVTVQAVTYEQAVIRVPVNMTEDMTLQGAKNIAGMKACDHARGNIELEGEPPAHWIEQDAPRDSFSTLHVEQVGLPLPSTDLVDTAAKEVLSQIDDQWRTDQAWQDLPMHRQRQIESNMRWLLEMRRQILLANTTIESLATLHERLRKMNAPLHLTG